MTNPEMGPVAARVVDWFLESARDLPWRRTLDPYAVWVSEIMLQQTQVRTVIPYWERWMHRLPTIARLARARESTVLKLWEGLGYYSRARNLQRAAREVMATHQGEFPRDYDKILSLSGIGRYTAGAIASIAFDQPAPILDGNVIRVLSRVCAIAGNPKEKAVNERLWALAAEAVVQIEVDQGKPKSGPMVFAGRRSALNQGLMELGATVCLPSEPSCADCPINRDCRAYQTGRVKAFPQVATRPRTTSREFHTFVLRRAGRYLVRRRAAGEVNAGFWEFPGIELGRTGESAAESFQRLFGFAGPVLAGLGELRHSITRYRYRQRVMAGEWPARESMRPAAGEWVSLDELQQRPFYSPQRRLLKLL